MQPRDYMLLSFISFIITFIATYLHTGSIFVTTNMFSKNNTQFFALSTFLICAYLWFFEYIFRYIFVRIFPNESNDLREGISLKSFDLLLTISLHFKTLNISIIANCIFDLTLTFFHYFYVMRAITYRSHMPDEQKSALKRQIYKGFFFLIVLDFLYIKYLLSNIKNFAKFTAEIFFLTEAMNLILQLVLCSIKHGITIYDETRPNEAGWPYKIYAVFAIDVIIMSFTFVMELLLFLVLAINFSLPLQVVRKLYIIIFAMHRKTSEFLYKIRIIREFDSKFETIEFDESDGNVECSICLDNVEKGKIIPCGHFFHKHCLKKWLENGKNCPVCRDDIEQSLRDGKRVMCEVKKKQLMKGLDVNKARIVVEKMKELEEGAVIVQNLIMKKQKELEDLHKLNEKFLAVQNNLYKINK